MVLGISADDVPRQARFRDRHALNMPLLADVNKKTAETYGVYKEKIMYGKKTMGIERTTFIIGRGGLIKKIFTKVKVDGHTDEVLQALDGI